MYRTKPKLLITVGEFIEGAGQSRVVHEEVKHLSHNYEITIVADLIVWQSPINAQLEDLSKTPGFFRSTRRLLKLMGENDLIHCHDSLKMMLAAAIASKPWVVTSHGIAPLRLRSNVSNKIKGGITSFSYPFLYRRATELVAISSYIQDWLREDSKRDAILIPNGAPLLMTLTQRTMPITLTLLYVGEISRRKGIADLVRAASLLPEDAVLNIAGAGDSGVFAGHSNGAGAQVRFLGLVTDSQLGYLYDNATCVISASYWEGYGLPIVEGFAHGTPALVRNNTNLRNLILESDAGRSFDEIEQIPTLLNEIVATWDALSANALNYASFHSWDGTFSEYNRIFAGLL